MCVIMIADTKPVPEESILKGFAANDAGAGVAYREGGFVHWVKGIQDPKQVVEIVKGLALPYVVHFRIPTEGGRRLGLTHPFPVDRKTDLALRGKTKGFVLFHNGHWSDWRRDVKEACIHSNTPMPSGKWSDTRAMAFVASIYGLGILETINEKAVAFGVDQVEVVPGGGFTQREGVWYSNMFWEHRGYDHSAAYNARMCHQVRCTRKDVDSDGMCPDHAFQKKLTTTLDSTSKITGSESDTGSNMGSNTGSNTDGSKKKASQGVSATGIPFDQVLELFRKGTLSKKQFKKARRHHEATLRATGIHLVKGQKHPTLH